MEEQHAFQVFAQEPESAESKQYFQLLQKELLEKQKAKSLEKKAQHAGDHSSDEL